MLTKRDHSPRLLRYAKEMRGRPTDAEKKLWYLLRDRNLSGWKFRRQHPVGGYIVDFFCPEARLAIELDGGQHSEPEAMRYDQGRTRSLEELGIRVLRFWDHDVLRETSAVMEKIWRVLEELRTAPSPRPSPGVPGEGERAGAPGAESRCEL